MTDGHFAALIVLGTVLFCAILAFLSERRKRRQPLAGTIEPLTQDQETTMTHNAGCSLPSLPSALIRVAIADLKKAERSKDYMVNMGHYHLASKASYDGETCTAEPATCHICLAGAVMAFSLGVPSTVTFAPSEYADDELTDKLYALDHLRCGNLMDGLSKLGVSKTKISATQRVLIPKEAGKHRSSYYSVPEYEHNKTAFKKEMLALADKLESVGL